MRPVPSPRIRRLQKLTRVGMWIAVYTSCALVFISSDWTFVACGCTFVLSVLSVIANLAAAGALSGDRRLGIGRQGGALSGRARDDDDGPEGEPTHPWPTLVTMSRLMPPAAGRRWLAEAESLLSEITPAQRGPAVRSYLRSAPQLAVLMWAHAALRRARLGPRRPS